MPSTESLFDAVYAAPDDDAPREQLARVLAAKGDPRGEFITLQLAAAKGAATKSEVKKAKALLKQHANAWAESLRGSLVFSSIEWERGFPVSASLAMRKTAADKELSIAVPALSTLRSLALGKSESGFEIDWLRRLLFGSPLRGLRAITGLWQGLVPDLLLSPLPWSVEWVHTLSWNTERPTTIANAFATGEGLPRLTRLDIQLATDPRTYEWLVTTAAGRRLRSLGMGGQWSELPRWHSQLVEWGDSMALERVIFGAEFSITGHPLDWVALNRTAAGWTNLTGRVGNPEVGPPSPIRSRLWEHRLTQLREAISKLPPGTIVENTIEWLPAPP